MTTTTLATTLMSLGLVLPATASAQHCGRVHIRTRGVTARVRVVHGHVSCRSARMLIAAAYHAADTRKPNGYGNTYGRFWRVSG